MLARYALRNPTPSPCILPHTLLFLSHPLELSLLVFFRVRYSKVQYSAKPGLTQCLCYLLHLHVTQVRRALVRGARGCLDLFPSLRQIIQSLILRAPSISFLLVKVRFEPPNMAPSLTNNYRLYRDIYAEGRHIPRNTPSPPF